MKKFLATLLCLFSANTFAAYALVVYSPSVNYMNTLTVSNTREQCEAVKANFEAKFADNMQSSTGKVKLKFECIDILDGGI